MTVRRREDGGEGGRRGKGEGERGIGRVNGGKLRWEMSIRQDSNLRPKELQSPFLPTELQVVDDIWREYNNKNDYFLNQQ